MIRAHYEWLMCPRALSRGMLTIAIKLIPVLIS